MTVRNSHCCGEVHGSKLALKMRNTWLTVKGLLILGLRKHLYGYLWLLFMANITENLKSELLLTLEFRAGNLGPFAIAWSSYSVAMVSISSYEIDRGKRHPKFQCQSP